MPLKVSAGLARKIGEANYGSRGASVNVEMELESSLVTDTPRLRERIRQLFDVVRSSLSEELNGNAGGNGDGNGQPQNGYNSNGNGSNQAPSQSQSSRPLRPATASQVKAIISIANRQHLDLKLILQNRFQTTRMEDLSIKQASELIDTLKSSSGA